MKFCNWSLLFNLDSDFMICGFSILGVLGEEEAWSDEADEE